MSPSSEDARAAGTPVTMASGFSRAPQGKPRLMPFCVWRPGLLAALVRLCSWWGGAEAAGIQLGEREGHGGHDGASTEAAH